MLTTTIVKIVYIYSISNPLRILTLSALKCKKYIKIWHIISQSDSNVLYPVFFKFLISMSKEHGHMHIHICTHIHSLSLSSAHPHTHKHRVSRRFHSPLCIRKLSSISKLKIEGKVN